MPIHILITFLGLLLPSSVVEVSSCRQQIPLDFINREEWGAAPSKKTLVNITEPVSYVIIHHTKQPKACVREKCKHLIRDLQKYHIDIGYDDIGFTYLIGTDGCVYEGRGWGIVGAHTTGYNKNGYGIALIGDFVETEPTREALASTKRLLEQGVEQQWLQPNYTLLGHSDVAKTNCPGTQLYNAIAQWEHFNSPKSSNQFNS